MCIWMALIGLGDIKIKNQKINLEDGRKMGRRDWKNWRVIVIDGYG